MQSSWDASGFQVAGSKDAVKRLAVCLDPVPESVEEAVKLGADMILSHHPLLLQPRLPKTRDAYHRVLSLLFKNDMALYSAHTSLDVNPEGPVAWLAEDLKLEDMVVIEPVVSVTSVFGFGVCGSLPKAARLDDFVKDVLRLCGLSAGSLCGPRPDMVRSVAVCPGSGSSLMAEAANLGADIFITGEIKHHAALEAPLCVLDVGHHSLEEEMMRRFSLALQKAAPEIIVTFIPSVGPISLVQI